MDEARPDRYVRADESKPHQPPWDGAPCGAQGAGHHARKNADAYCETWQTNRPTYLISNASVARVLWLLADMESDVGRAFWQASDKPAR